MGHAHFKARRFGDRERPVGPAGHSEKRLGGNSSVDGKWPDLPTVASGDGCRSWKRRTGKANERSRPRAGSKSAGIAGLSRGLRFTLNNRAMAIGRGPRIPTNGTRWTGSRRRANSPVHGSANTAKPAVLYRALPGSLQGARVTYKKSIPHGALQLRWRSSVAFLITGIFLVALLLGRARPWASGLRPGRDQAQAALPAPGLVERPRTKGPKTKIQDRQLAAAGH